MPHIQQEPSLKTVFDNQAIVVSYPNQIGDVGRYDLRDQRTYFSQFDGGAQYIFQLALENIIDGDLLAFHQQCLEYRDNHYHEDLQYNMVDLAEYHRNKREFQRRIFDIYRFAKTSLKSLGDETDFSRVSRLSTNHVFDTGSFIIK